jgi:hypothetical protein
VTAVCFLTLNCGAGPEVAGLAPPEFSAVDVTPASASLLTGATQAFVAAGRLPDGTSSPVAVSWSATGGTISAGGLYMAGNTGGTFRVIARQSGGTLADTVVVTLNTAPPVLQAVILTPGSSSMLIGGTQQLSVSGQWSDGSTTTPSVTYSATGGSINANGLYTAGSTAGTFRVIARQSGGTLADTGVVTVLDPGTIQPGNLFSFSFENGTYGGLSDGGGGPPSSYSIMSSGGYDGARYAEANLSSSGSDGAANMYWNGGTPRNDIWLVVAIKVITPPSTGLATQKMVIFREAGYGTQLGEMNQIEGQYIWNWLDGGYNIPFKSVSGTVGQWHLWKFHFDQTGTRPVITIWVDGVQVFQDTEGRTSKAPTSIIDFGGVLNGGSGASRFGFDYIQIGTVDPWQP